jgi:hypothetical protein
MSLLYTATEAWVLSSRRGLTKADVVINGYKREVHVEKTAWRPRAKEFIFILLDPQLAILLVKPSSRTLA